MNMEGDTEIISRMRQRGTQLSREEEERNLNEFLKLKTKEPQSRKEREQLRRELAQTSDSNENFGVAGRKTGVRVYAAVQKDDDDLENIDDFFGKGIAALPPRRSIDEQIDEELNGTLDQSLHSEHMELDTSTVSTTFSTKTTDKAPSSVPAAATTSSTKSGDLFQDFDLASELHALSDDENSAKSKPTGASRKTRKQEPHKAPSSTDSAPDTPPSGPTHKTAVSTPRRGRPPSTPVTPATDEVRTPSPPARPHSPKRLFAKDNAVSRGDKPTEPVSTTATSKAADTKPAKDAQKGKEKKGKKTAEKPPQASQLFESDEEEERSENEAVAMETDTTPAGEQKQTSKAKTKTAIEKEGHSHASKGRRGAAASAKPPQHEPESPYAPVVHDTIVPLKYSSDDDAGTADKEEDNKKGKGKGTARGGEKAREKKGKKESKTKEPEGKKERNEAKHEETETESKSSRKRQTASYKRKRMAPPEREVIDVDKVAVKDEPSDEEMAEKRTGGARWPKRRRLPPLEWWKGERVVYGRRKSGIIPGLQFVLPSVVKVVKVSDSPLSKMVSPEAIPGTTPVKETKRRSKKTKGEEEYTQKQEESSDEEIKEGELAEETPPVKTHTAARAKTTTARKERSHTKASAAATTTATSAPATTTTTTSSSTSARRTGAKNADAAKSGKDTMSFSSQLAATLGLSKDEGGAAKGPSKKGSTGESGKEKPKRGARRAARK